MSSKPHPIAHVSCASALSSAHESAEVGISPSTTIIRDKMANAIEGFDCFTAAYGNHSVSP